MHYNTSDINDQILNDTDIAANNDSNDRFLLHDDVLSCLIHFTQCDMITGESVIFWEKLLTHSLTHTAWLDNFVAKKLLDCLSYSNSIETKSSCG